MARWEEFEREEPELAARARGLLEARKHKTIATLRRDGSPRISGTEAEFKQGDLYFGSMWKAVKALDLRRDPRFALHGGSEDPPDWSADAKVAGRVEEITDPDRIADLYGGDDDTPPGAMHVFRADVAEVVVTGLNEDRTKLVIESWHEGRGAKRTER